MATETKNIKEADGWVTAHTVAGELLIEVENGSCYAYFGALAPTGVEGATHNWSSENGTIHYIGADKLWIHGRRGTCTVTSTDETSAGALAFATQIEVNAGTLTDRIVSPKTFNDSNQLALINTAIGKLNNTITRKGMLTMVQSAGTKELTTVYQKMSFGGVKVIQEQNGHFDHDDVTSRLNVVTTGIYSLGICGSVEFPVNSELELSCFINGVEYSPDAHPILQGQGAGKPLQIIVNVTLPLTAGDYVEMYAKMDAPATLTMNGNNTSIEKKVFDIV